MLPFILLLLCSLPLSVSAETWKVCHLQVKIIDRPTASFPLLQAKVLHVRAAPIDSECPATGEIITFIPEAPDYQNPLPYKRWPRRGDEIKMRYQYLDGECKNDGHPAPCRIKHYPIP
jgi:hypothetical protein